MKLIQPQVVIDATRQIGWPARTAVLGAILLTGYLGGAVASQARHSDPLFTHDLLASISGFSDSGFGHPNSIADPLEHVARSARTGSVHEQFLIQGGL